MRNHGTSRRAVWGRGLTLMETVVALGIVALTVPVLVGAMATAVESRRRAEDDTRAAWMTQRVLGELRQAWSGGKSVFGDKAPAYPAFPGADGVILMAFDQNGEFVRLASKSEYDKGIRERGVGYLLTVEGSAHRPAGLTLKEPLSKVRIVVEAPAQGMPAKRTKLAFTTLREKEGKR